MDVSYHVQVADSSGTRHLESLILEDTASGARRSVPADALFVLIGSQPRTEWLGESIARGHWGLILTGADLLDDGDTRWRLDRAPLPLETSLPGVFAVGDARRGSVKRVASAAGEDAVSIPLVHRWLDTTAEAKGRSWGRHQDRSGRRSGISTETLVAFTAATASMPGSRPSSSAASRLSSDTNRCDPAWIST